MYLFWRLFHWLNTLKSAHWVTFGPRYFLATVLVASAALVAIGAIAAVAEIAFDEQSWVALIVLLVTAVQVRDITNITKTSQELRMLSSVTINCQITKIVMNSGSQLSEL